VILEAPPGFEPGMEVLQTSALPLGYGAGRDVGWASMRARLHGGAATAWQPSPQSKGEGWSGKRDSNPRLRPWQGRTLPLSYSRPRRDPRTRNVPYGRPDRQGSTAFGRQATRGKLQASAGLKPCPTCPYPLAQFAGLKPCPTCALCSATALPHMAQFAGLHPCPTCAACRIEALPHMRSLHG
jgi:hypothetical protein